jgi:hypothetical protein
MLMLLAWKKDQDSLNHAYDAYGAYHGVWRDDNHVYRLEARNSLT